MSVNLHKVKIELDEWLKNRPNTKSFASPFGLGDNIIHINMYTLFKWFPLKQDTLKSHENNIINKQITKWLLEHIEPILLKHNIKEISTSWCYIEQYKIGNKYRITNHL